MIGTPYQSQDQGNRASLAKAFLESLPIVKHEELPENSQICHICKEPFDAPNPDPEMMESAEVAVKLPCSHIMGFECLKRWLEDNSSCPMCRAKLFGHSNDVPHAAISEYADLLQQLTFRQRSEAFSRLMLEADADSLELSVLRMELAELLERMLELHAAPDTAENRATVARVARRNEDINAALDRVHARLREREL